jgi:hypothetical protein
MPETLTQKERILTPKSPSGHGSQGFTSRSSPVANALITPVLCLLMQQIDCSCHSFLARILRELPGTFLFVQMLIQSTRRSATTAAKASTLILVLLCSKESMSFVFMGAVMAHLRSCHQRWKNVDPIDKAASLSEVAHDWRGLWAKLAQYPLLYRPCRPPHSIHREFLDELARRLGASPCRGQPHSQSAHSVRQVLTAYKYRQAAIYVDLRMMA